MVLGRLLFISSSKFFRMNFFLKRCAIIAIVPVFLIIIPFYIIETSGETFSLEEMIQRQKQDSSVL